MVGPTKVKPAFFSARLKASASAVTAGIWLRSLEWLILGAPPTNDQSSAGGSSRRSQAWAFCRAALSFRRLRMIPGSCIRLSRYSSLIPAKRSGSKPNSTSR
ncbi:hypothetical protein D3C71_1611000 [compost metagenome]